MKEQVQAKEKEEAVDRQVDLLDPLVNHTHIHTQQQPVMSRERLAMLFNDACGVQFSLSAPVSPAMQAHNAPAGGQREREKEKEKESQGHKLGQYVFS